MAFAFHKDTKTYFDIQYENSKTSLIPFIFSTSPDLSNYKVLEIGCGEAGVLKSFIELGAHGTGIELHESRVEAGKAFLQQEINNYSIRFITKNIYDIDVSKDLDWKFDLIILKDVIEHIPDQDRFIPKLKDFLNPGGKIFFGFPPWYMPFGGHQQICKSKLLSRLPYYHLLPSFLYKSVLNLFGEDEGTVKELLEIKDTGISISRFEKIARKSGYSIEKRLLYFISPIYKYKFNLNTRKQSKLVGKIPYLRDFVSTSVYYLIQS